MEKEFKNILKTGKKEDIEKYINDLSLKHPDDDKITYWKVYTDLVLNNNTKDSLNTVKGLLEKDKNNKTYLNFIGNIHLLEADYDKSIEYYKKTLNQYNNKFIKEDNCIFALTGSMEAYTSLKDKKNSNKTQPKLLKLFNNDKTQVLQYGNKLKGEKNYIEALKIYNTLLYKDKKNIMVNLSKADLYEKTGDFNLAIQTYNTVLNEHSGNIGALNKQGKCLIQNNEIKKGEENFNKVLLINSNNTEALYGLAYSKNIQGKTKDALEYYDKTLEQNPYHTEALLAKAKILKNEKNYVGVLETYNKLLENDKKNIEALEGVAEIYHIEKEYEQEIETLNKILKIKNKDINILNKKIKAQYELKSYQEALNTCNEVLNFTDNKETIKLKKQIENKINNPSLLSSIKSKLGF